jgi:uncharacterized protein (DUF1330 family)
VPLFALNLFDLAENEDYRAYSRRSVDAIAKCGGAVIALGQLTGGAVPVQGDTNPRQVMVLVQWPDRAAFESFLGDEAHADLHPLRERGTKNYLWWLYEQLEDLRPVFNRTSASDG